MPDSAADRNEPTAWIRIPSEEDARRDLPSDYAYDDALLPSFFRLVNAHRKISQVFWPLQAAVMQGEEDSRLSPREREMIAVAAAVAQDCDY
jgi:alkylhydroperoxidase/carboxymuconolactone decarboxylase family protein YurZ